MILHPNRLVLETLTPLPSDRKCFRMINGVLVERTVGDVLPQLQSNSDNMNKVLVELAKQYKTKQDDMEKWKVCPDSQLHLQSIMLITVRFTEEEQDPGGAAMKDGSNLTFVCEAVLQNTLTMNGIDLLWTLLTSLLLHAKKTSRLTTLRVAIQRPNMRYRNTRSPSSPAFY